MHLPRRCGFLFIRQCSMGCPLDQWQVSISLRFRIIDHHAAGRETTEHFHSSLVLLDILLTSVFAKMHAIGCNTVGRDMKEQVCMRRL